MMMKQNKWDSDTAIPFTLIIGLMDEISLIPHKKFKKIKRILQKYDESVYIGPCENLNNRCNEIVTILFSGGKIMKVIKQLVATGFIFMLCMLIMNGFGIK